MEKPLVKLQVFERKNKGINQQVMCSIHTVGVTCGPDASLVSGVLFNK